MKGERHGTLECVHQATLNHLHKSQKVSRVHVQYVSGHRTKLTNTYPTKITNFRSNANVFCHLFSKMSKHFSMVIMELPQWNKKVPLALLGVCDCLRHTVHVSCLHDCHSRFQTLDKIDRMLGYYHKTHYMTTCISHAHHMLFRQLMCVGPVEHKLTIKAKEDSYDRTKTLMIKAEEERTKGGCVSIAECLRSVTLYRL